MTAPRDPREERYRPIARTLFSEVVAVAVLSVVAVLVGGRVGNAAAVVAVVILVFSPLLRVLWLVVRWFRRGDPRYAMVGVAVLCIPIAGYLLSR